MEFQNCLMQSLHIVDGMHIFSGGFHKLVYNSEISIDRLNQSLSAVSTFSE